MGNYSKFKKRIISQTEDFAKRHNFKSSVHIKIDKNAGQFDHGYADTTHRNTRNPNRDLHWQVGFGARGNPAMAEAEHWHEMGHATDHEYRRRNGTSINDHLIQERTRHDLQVSAEKRANAYAKEEIRKMPHPQQAQAMWFLRAGLNTHMHPEFNTGQWVDKRKKSYTFGQLTNERLRREGKI